MADRGLEPPPWPSCHAGGCTASCDSLRREGFQSAPVSAACFRKLGLHISFLDFLQSLATTADWMQPQRDPLDHRTLYRLQHFDNQVDATRRVRDPDREGESSDSEAERIPQERLRRLGAEGVAGSGTK